MSVSFFISTGQHSFSLNIIETQKNIVIYNFNEFFADLQPQFSSIFHHSPINKPTTPHNTLPFQVQPSYTMPHNATKCDSNGQTQKPLKKTNNSITINQNVSLIDFDYISLGLLLMVELKDGLGLTLSQTCVSEWTR